MNQRRTDMETLGRDAAALKALTKITGAGSLIFIGIILAKTLGFFRQFIIIRMLSPAEYGLFALAFAIVTLLSDVACLGIPIGIQRYIAIYSSKEDAAGLKGTMRSSLKIMAISVSLITVLLMLFSGLLSRFFSESTLRTALIIFCAAIPAQAGSRIQFLIS